MRRPTALCTVAVVAAVATACTPAPSTGEGDVLVAAAASLTDVLEELAVAFERANPGTDVVLNLAGSATLREQLLAGAPADLVVPASPQIMDELLAAGVVADEPTLLATNRLAIAVPAGNPGEVEGLADLADEQRFIGLCAAGVPCGDLAREALASAGITAAVDTLEPDVRALLTKVATGELDAGITYVTDARALDDVELVPIPDEHQATARYPVARVAGGPNPLPAAAFLDFLLSDVARTILEDAGFGTP